MHIIKLVEKKIINNKLNLITSGKVLYVRYLLIKNDEIKISNFIGLCITKKRNVNAITIQNVVKKEKIQITIYLNSPLLLSILIVKKYKKKYRLNKLYYK